MAVGLEIHDIGHEDLCTCRHSIEVGVTGQSGHKRYRVRRPIHNATNASAHDSGCAAMQKTRENSHAMCMESTNMLDYTVFTHGD